MESERGEWNVNDEIWRAIVACDPVYDGQIYYGVSTTGVFCKPSCKSRTPKRENVTLYHDPLSPLKAGLRPCKRCRPDLLFHKTYQEELVEKLVQLIHDKLQESLTLADMAAKLYVSPFYLQKCFTKIMKLSPAKYVTLQRIKTAKIKLQNTEESVTCIALSCGFRNSAYFSSVFLKEIGHSPTAYRHMIKSSLY